MSHWPRGLPGEATTKLFVEGRRKAGAGGLNVSDEPGGLKEPVMMTAEEELDEKPGALPQPRPRATHQVMTCAARRAHRVPARCTKSVMSPEEEEEFVWEPPTGGGATGGGAAGAGPAAANSSPTCVRGESIAEGEEPSSSSSRPPAAPLPPRRRKLVVVVLLLPPQREVSAI